jgi:serine/threonine protein kinase
MMNTPSPRAAAGSSYHAAIVAAMANPGLGGSPSPSHAAQAAAAAAAGGGSGSSRFGSNETRALPPRSLGAGSESAVNRTINFSDPTEFFQLQSKIGEGSYGAVFKAVDFRDNADVAIKVLQFQGRDSLKLRKEIHILKQCNSKYIVGYKGAFQRGSNVWIVMEVRGAHTLFTGMHAQ